MEFTHFNESGRAYMVDVSNKDITNRIAVAKGKIKMSKETIEMIKNHKLKKGDVLSVAQIAGIIGAKKTSDLIPMCHNIFISSADIDFEVLDREIIVTSTVKTSSQTGIEMEALTSVSLACLTIYDMCKAVDKEMEITDIYLEEKLGGKSGHYKKSILNEIGRVESINISETKGVVKLPIGEGNFIQDYGLEGDAHSGKWHRQVSLLDLSSFEKMRSELEDEKERLVPGVFAENITTSGLLLYKFPVGTIFKIGDTIHELTQIGKTCHTGCEISKIVGTCVMPKEGIFTRVLKGGQIKEGDIITILK